MAEYPIRIRISLAPVTKKNSQQILTNKATGRAFIMPSKKYKTYEKEAVKLLLSKFRLFPDGTFPISEKVNVKCISYMPTHRIVDLSNLEECTDDVLVKAGILADDNSRIVAGHDGSRVLYDKEFPRTDITITKMEEDDDEYNEDFQEGQSE